jgi:hypothetical protein
LAASFYDICDDAFEIVPNVRRLDSNRPDSSTGKPSISSLIALRICPQLMRQPIYLDRNRRLETEEVEVVGSVLMLLAEFESIRAGFQHVPKTALRRGHRFTKLTRLADTQEDPSTSDAGPPPLEIEGRKIYSNSTMT